MTDATDDTIDYVRAIADASAFLAAHSDDGRAGRWGLWAALSPSDDLRYPVPELDPRRR